MTRKTGKMAVKAKQLVRSAKLAKYKRELSEAGVSLSLPKPSAKDIKEKEEQLKKLYKELFPEEAKGEKSVPPAEESTEPAEEEEKPETDDEYDDSAPCC